MSVALEAVGGPSTVRPRARTPFLERFGPWALVTGASDGIGREFARSLARRGANVVLVARRKERLEALAAELRGAGVETLVLPLDLAQPQANQELLAATSQIDVGLVVASAGFGTSGGFLAADLAQELGMIDVNCRAVAELVHGFGKRLVERRGGGMVLLSSLLAFQGVPRAANYAATKAWVQTFAEGLRVELAPSGVEVLSCAPGPVASGFGDRARMVMDGAAPAEAVADETLSRLGRAGTVRPGFLSKFLGWSLAPLPRAGRVRVLAKVMAGMTSHHK
ncbi:MAG: SDR family oxidoreductase [Deltaproteobacteria bacterium]|nr:SDR family oxidoreductase [Deltaproteobacteria bacterium]